MQSVITELYRYNSAIKYSDSKLSSSPPSITERHLMVEMQKKLELIENKLNFFMEESKWDKGFEKNAFQILDSEESKFIEQARRQLNLQRESVDKQKQANTKYSVQGKTTSDK